MFYRKVFKPHLLSSNMTDREEENLIEKNRNNPEFLERVIEQFLRGEEIGREYGSFPVANAIRNLPNRGTRYFRKLYERILSLDDSDEELSARVYTNWHAKVAAFKRIRNAPYLKKLVGEVPDGYQIGAESPQSIAVRAVNHNQPWLITILNTKEDTFIKAAALGKITDLAVLAEYACAPAGSGRETFPVGYLRRVAVGRIKEFTGSLLEK